MPMELTATRNQDDYEPCLHQKPVVGGVQGNRVCEGQNYYLYSAVALYESSLGQGPAC